MSVITRAFKAPSQIPSYEKKQQIQIDINWIPKSALAKLKSYDRSPA